MAFEDWLRARMQGIPLPTQGVAPPIPGGVGPVAPLPYPTDGGPNPIEQVAAIMTALGIPPPPPPSPPGPGYSREGIGTSYGAWGNPHSAEYRRGDLPLPADARTILGATAALTGAPLPNVPQAPPPPMPSMGPTPTKSDLDLMAHLVRRQAEVNRATNLENDPFAAIQHTQDVAEAMGPTDPVAAAINATVGDPVGAAKDVGEGLLTAAGYPQRQTALALADIVGKAATGEATAGIMSTALLNTPLGEAASHVPSAQQMFAWGEDNPDVVKKAYTEGYVAKSGEHVKPGREAVLVAYTESFGEGVPGFLRDMTFQILTDPTMLFPAVAEGGRAVQEVGRGIEAGADVARAARAADVGRIGVATDADLAARGVFGRAVGGFGKGIEAVGRAPDVPAEALGGVARGVVDVAENIPGPIGQGVRWATTESARSKARVLEQMRRAQLALFGTSEAAQEAIRAAAPTPPGGADPFAGTNLGGEPRPTGGAPTGSAPRGVVFGSGDVVEQVGDYKIARAGEGRFAVLDETYRNVTGYLPDQESARREAQRLAAQKSVADEAESLLSGTTEPPDEVVARLVERQNASPVPPDEEAKTATTRFTTAKGSTYEVTDRRTTIRNKAFRPEHGPTDVGPQPESEVTVYVTPDDAKTLGEFQVQGADRSVQLLDNGRVGVRYESGPDAGKFERRTVVSAQDDPAVGLIPVETWNNGTRVHFGNEITGIEAGAANPPAPSRLDEIGRELDEIADARMGAGAQDQRRLNAESQKLIEERDGIRAVGAEAPVSPDTIGGESVGVPGGQFAEEAPPREWKVLPVDKIKSVERGGRKIKEIHVSGTGDDRVSVYRVHLRSKNDLANMGIHEDMGEGFFYVDEFGNRSEVFTPGDYWIPETGRNQETAYKNLDDAKSAIVEEDHDYGRNWYGEQGVGATPEITPPTTEPSPREPALNQSAESTSEWERMGLMGYDVATLSDEDLRLAWQSTGDFADNPPPNFPKRTDADRRFVSKRRIDIWDEVSRRHPEFAESGQVQRWMNAPRSTPPPWGTEPEIAPPDTIPGESVGVPGGQPATPASKMRQVEDEFDRLTAEQDAPYGEGVHQGYGGAFGDDANKVYLEAVYALSQGKEADASFLFGASRGIDQAIDEGILSAPANPTAITEDAIADRYNLPPPIDEEGARLAEMERREPVAVPENIRRILVPRDAQKQGRIIDRVVALADEEADPRAKAFFDAYNTRFEENYNGKRGINYWNTETRNQTEHLTSLRNATPDQARSWFVGGDPTQGLTAEGVAESARRKTLAEPWQARAIATEDYVDQVEAYRTAGFGEPPPYQPDWADPATETGVDRRFVFVDRDPETGKITNTRDIRQQWLAGARDRPDVRNLFETAVTTPDHQLATDIRYAMRSGKYDQWRKLANTARDLRERLYGEDSVLRTADRRALDEVQAQEAIAAKSIPAKGEAEAEQPLPPPWTPEGEALAAAPPARKPDPDRVSQEWEGQPGKDDEGKNRRFNTTWETAKRQSNRGSAEKVWQTEVNRLTTKGKNPAIIRDATANRDAFFRAWDDEAAAAAPPPPPPPPTEPIQGLTAPPPPAAPAADPLMRTMREGGIAGDYGLATAPKASRAPDWLDKNLRRDWVWGQNRGAVVQRNVDQMTGDFGVSVDDVFRESPDTKELFSRPIEGDDRRLGDIFLDLAKKKVAGGAAVEDAITQSIDETIALATPKQTGNRFWNQNMLTKSLRALGHAYAAVSAQAKGIQMFSWANVPRRIVGDITGNSWGLLMNGKVEALGRQFDLTSDGVLRGAIRASDNATADGLAQSSLGRLADGLGLAPREADVEVARLAGREELDRSIRNTGADEYWLKKFGRRAAAVTGFGPSDIARRAVSAIDMTGRGALHFTEMLGNLAPARADFIDGILTRAGKVGEDGEGLATRLSDYDVFSPADVRRYAEEFGYAKGDAERLARDWRSSVTKLDRNAADEVNRVFFSYRTTNLDEALNKAFFYHYWASRATPLYLQAAIKNPGVMATYAHLKDGMQRECDAREGQRCGYLKVFETAAGMGGYFNPLLLISTTLINFENDFNNPDARTIDRVLQKVPAQLNPILQAAISAVGASSSDYVDPLASYGPRRMWTAGLNLAKNEGWFGAEKGRLVDPTPQFWSNVVGASSAWLEEHQGAFPWAKKVIEKAPDRGNTALLHNRAIELIYRAHDVPAGTDPFSLDAAIQDEIVHALTAIDTNSHEDPYAAQAFSDWASPNFARAAMAMVLPSTAIGDTQLDELRRLRAEGKGTEFPSAALTGVRNELSLVESGGPTDVKLEIQSEAYKDVGSPMARQRQARFNTIIYTPEKVGTGIVAGGHFYRTDALAAMPRDEMDPTYEAGDLTRKDLASLWMLEQHNGPGDQQALYDARDAFTADPANAEYAAYSAWASDARDIGIDKLSKVSPAYRQYIESLPSDIRDDPARLDQMAFSPDAYQYTIGERPSLYADEPKAPLDISQVNPVDLLAPAKTTGDATAKKKDPGRQLLDDLVRYNTDLVLLDAQLQAYTGNPDSHWASVEGQNPQFESAMRWHMANAGIDIPSKPQSITYYEKWAEARQYQGKPAGVADYIEWARETQATYPDIDLDVLMAMAVAGRPFYGTVLDPIPAATATQTGP